MYPVEELLAYVNRVALMRRAQKRYATRMAGTTLAEVRRLEAEVDEYTRHYQSAPIPFDLPADVEQPATAEVEQPAELPMVPPLIEPVADRVEQPADVPAIAGIEQPADAPAEVEQPAEQTVRRRRHR